MKKPDPAKARAAVLAIADWIAADSPEAARAAGIAQPSRSQLADAVRHTARLLAADAPGHSVELRVPPFVAVQCIEGPGILGESRPMWWRPAHMPGCVWPPATATGMNWWLRQTRRRRVRGPVKSRSGCPSSSSNLVLVRL